MGITLLTLIDLLIILLSVVYRAPGDVLIGKNFASSRRA